jgi:hydrogenase maturation protease
MSSAGTTTACRALIGGFGQPGMRDLDVGRHLIEYLRELTWPPGVVVEDLSSAALLVLHRLQELRPAKVVLVGAVPRGQDLPAVLRRYRLDPTPARPEDVRDGLQESASGLVDLDHTLAVARHWGGLPVDTVVIEVEPADCSFGLGFSEELASAFDPVLAMVRHELGCTGDAAMLAPDVGVEDLVTGEPGPEALPATQETQEIDVSHELASLVGYARQHAGARLELHRGPTPVDGLSETPGVMMAGRCRPWGVFLANGSDWFDTFPLGDEGVAAVMGDVVGRGFEATAAMTDLRAAVRAYSVLNGDSPALVVGHLDRLAAATGVGDNATLIYLTLRSRTGEVRFTNAGHCPPLLLGGDDVSGRFLYDPHSGPLGAAGDVERPEARVQLAPGATLLLFTDGLVRSEVRPMADGLEKVRQVASGGPTPLEDLCDHVIVECSDGLRADDDICLLAMRLTTDADPSTAAWINRATVETSRNSFAGSDLTGLGARSCASTGHHIVPDEDDAETPANRS